MIKRIIIIAAVIVPQILIGQDIQIEADTTHCTGDTVTLTLSESDVLANWEIPDSNGLSPTDNTSLSEQDTIKLNCKTAGSYSIKATPLNQDQLSINIHVYEVSAGFQIDTSKFNTAVVHLYSDTLSSPYSFPYRYVWDFDDGVTDTSQIEGTQGNEKMRSIISHEYKNTENDSVFDIQLTVTNAEGCKADSTISYTIRKVFDAPNVFTPNGDGVNDLFTARSNGQIKFSMTIYSRWGNVVFESETPTKRVVWDGKLNGGRYVSSGVYYYVVIPENAPKYEKLTGFVHVMTAKE